MDSNGRERGVRDDGLEVDFGAIVAQAHQQEAPLYKRLVQVAAGRDKHSVAVVSGDVHVTFNELVRRSGDLCDKMRGAGVRPRDAVGAVLRNSIEALVAAFACWKLGAALVPLNPRLQGGELQRIAQDIGLRAFVSTPAEGHALQVSPLLDAIDHLWLFRSATDGWSCEKSVDASRSRAEGRRPTARVHWPSTIQYSTGSTGVPKRITRTQGQFLGEQFALSGLLDVTSADRVLCVAPIFHGYSLMFSVLVPLLSGATVVMLDHNVLPAEIAATIERERVTGLSTVPFMYELMAGLRKRRDLSCLRYAVSGGAPLASHVARAFEEAYGVRIRQGYGSTETGAVAIAEPGAGAGQAGVVGRPIPGVVVRIVDEEGREKNAGEEGFVHVRSPFAAERYDRQPQTRESWFDERGFLPGDVGRLSPVGELVLAGRHRGFINVGGNKVDPSEVESVLRQIPGVVEAVVFGVAQGGAGERVYAVLETSGELTQEEVRRQCASSLAPFKLPRVIRYRDALPRSPLGKILRQKVIDDSLAEHQAAEPFSVPGAPGRQVLPGTD